MSCKLCLENSPLVKAHIIPEAFARVLRDWSGGRSPILIGSTQRFPKRAPVGSYDSTILCAQCERMFGEWDDYAAKVLIQGWDKYENWENGFINPMSIMDTYDYAKLKLFLISCAWRISVSSRPEYQHRGLGPFEAQAREALCSRDPGGKHFFSTFIVRWITKTVRDRNAALSLSVEQFRFASVNAWQLCLGDVVAYIKTDAREFPDAFQPYLLQPGRGLVIIGLDFGTSRDKRETFERLRDAHRRAAKFVRSSP